MPTPRTFAQSACQPRQQLGGGLPRPVDAGGGRLCSLGAVLHLRAGNPQLPLVSVCATTSAVPSPELTQRELQQMIIPENLSTASRSRSELDAFCHFLGPVAGCSLLGMASEGSRDISVTSPRTPSRSPDHIQFAIIAQICPMAMNIAQFNPVSQPSLSVPCLGHFTHVCVTGKPGHGR